MASPESGLKRRESAPALSPLEQALAKRLGREKNPIHLEIEMGFGAHSTKEDADIFAESIAKADLILLEGPGGSKESNHVMAVLAKGERSLGEAQNIEIISAHRKRILELIENTKKTVLTLDIAENDPLIPELESVTKSLQDFLLTTGLEKPALDEAVRRYRELLERFLVANTKRDEVILANVEKRIAEAIKTNPILRTKSPLKIFTLYGAMHTPLYEDMQRRHPSSTSRFSATPFSYQHGEEYRRRKRSGQETPPDLLVRGMMSNMCTDIILSMLTPSPQEGSKQNEIVRKVIDDFSVEELQNLYKFLITEEKFAMVQEIIVQRMFKVFPSGEAS